MHAAAHSAVHPAGCVCHERVQLHCCSVATSKTALPPSKSRPAAAAQHPAPAWAPSTSRCHSGAFLLSSCASYSCGAALVATSSHLPPARPARYLKSPVGACGKGERGPALRWRRRRQLGGGGLVAGPGPCACCDHPPVILATRQDRHKARSCPPLTCWPWGVAAEGVAAAPPPPVSHPHMLLASAGSGAAQKPASQPPDLNGATDAPTRSDHGGGRVGEGSDRLSLPRQTCMGRRRPLPPLRSESGSPSSLYSSCCSHSAELHRSTAVLPLSSIVPVLLCTAFLPEPSRRMRPRSAGASSAASRGRRCWTRRGTWWTAAWWSST